MANKQQSMTLREIMIKELYYSNPPYGWDHGEFDSDWYKNKQLQKKYKNYGRYLESLDDSDLLSTYNYFKSNVDF